MSKTPKNPFSLFPLHDPRHFCGRQELLEEMGGHLDNGKHLVLQSLPGMGATSVLLRLLGDHAKPKKRPGMYVDLGGVRDMNGVVRALATGILTQIENGGKEGTSEEFIKMTEDAGLELHPDGHTSHGARQSPETALDAIATYLASLKHPVLMALDGTRQLSLLPATKIKGKAVDAPAALRLWVGRLVNAQAIMTGGPAAYPEPAQGKNSWSKVAVVHALHPLPADEVLPFIVDRFAKAHISIKANLLDEMYLWCGGQTRALMHLSQGLYQTAAALPTSSRKVKRRMVQEAFGQMIATHHPAFSTMANLLTHTQWDVLRSVATEELAVTPLSRDFAERHHLGAPSSVKTALQMLILHGLLCRTADGYRVQDEVLRKWVATG